MSRESSAWLFCFCFNPRQRLTRDQTGGPPSWTWLNGVNRCCAAEWLPHRRLKSSHWSGNTSNQSPCPSAMVQMMSTWSRVSQVKTRAYPSRSLLCSKFSPFPLPLFDQTSGSRWSGTCRSGRRSGGPERRLCLVPVQIFTKAAASPWPLVLPPHFHLPVLLPVQDM